MNMIIMFHLFFFFFSLLLSSAVLIPHKTLKTTRTDVEVTCDRAHEILYVLTMFAILNAFYTCAWTFFIDTNFQERIETMFFIDDFDDNGDDDDDRKKKGKKSLENVRMLERHTTQQKKKQMNPNQFREEIEAKKKNLLRMKVCVFCIIKFIVDLYRTMRLKIIGI